MNQVLGELHIEDFCKDTAKILLLLYKNFPKKITLYVEDVCGPDEPDEFGLHSPRHTSCLGAMHWLAENGFITYSQTVRQEATEDVMLTQKAFVSLSSTTLLLSEASLQKDANFASQAAEIYYILGNKSSETLRSAMLRFISFN